MSDYPTLSTLLAMDAQALFDHIAGHLLHQGRPCRRDNDSTCLYRGPGGACAVGAIIPESCYTPQMEEKPLGDLLDWCRHSSLAAHQQLARVFERFFMLLHELQRIHDRCPSQQWRTALLETAAAYCLSENAVTAS